jgi:hypothetical protein
MHTGAMQVQMPKSNIFLRSRKRVGCCCCCAEFLAVTYVLVACCLSVTSGLESCTGWLRCWAGSCCLRGPAAIRQLGPRIVRRTDVSLQGPDTVALVLNHRLVFHQLIHAYRLHLVFRPVAITQSTCDLLCLVYPCTSK